MASSNQTNPCTHRPDDLWSLGNRPQRKASVKNTNSNDGSDCLSVSGSSREGYIITAHTPVSKWTISPIKSSARHPKVRNAAIHDFPSTELKHRYEERKLSPPVSGCSVDFDVYQHLKLFDISPDVGNQGTMCFDDWSCNNEQPQETLATRSSGQVVDQFASVSAQNTALTPDRSWAISPIKSSRRNSKRPSYPSQELNHQYDALQSSLPDSTNKSDTEGRTSMATSKLHPPEVTTSMAIEPTHDLSPDVGGRRNNVAAPKKEHGFPEEKLFYSSRRKKTICTTGEAIIPTSLDILRGRGGLTNRWAGNLRFREEARKLRTIYRNATTHDEKYLLTWELINRVDDYGGRFLQIGTDKQWYELNDQDARKKCSQGEEPIVIF